MKEPNKSEGVPVDYWPCACVKRDRKRHMTHIKAHHPSVQKCRVCGCTKEQHDKIAAETRPR